MLHGEHILPTITKKTYDIRCAVGFEGFEARQRRRLYGFCGRHSSAFAHGEQICSLFIYVISCSLYALAAAVGIVRHFSDSRSLLGLLLVSFDLYALAAAVGVSW